MPTIRSNGVWIHFEQDGEPAWPTVLLLHGFASSAQDNWVASGWVKRLREAKRRTVRLDFRGHGQSEKPRDPAAYGLDNLASDVEEVLRYANARSVDLFGYSMGARIALHVAERKPSRLRSLILGGAGARAATGLPENDAITAALEASDPSAVTSPVARGFRAFAESRGNDLRALAALRRGSRGGGPNAEVLAKFPFPTLVWAGSKDELVGDIAGLAALLPNSRTAVIPDADHLSAVAHPASFDAVLGFLASLERSS